MLIIDGLMQVIDRLAPFRLAESWDNVGLQLGDPKAPARRIAVALEVTLAIVRQTLSRRADALVVHHPLIFQPLKTLSRESPQGAMISDLIAGGVALIAAHTNLDVSPAGTNAALAELIGLRRLTPLFDLEPQPAAYKFVVYVPQGYEAAIIEAIARGGGGVIGAYDHCSYRCAGIGTYRPLKGARPFAGRVGRLEQAVEWRLEAEVPRAALAQVLREVRSVHPYEEMAYDVFPRFRLTAQRGRGQGPGVGGQDSGGAEQEKQSAICNPQSVIPFGAGLAGDLPRRTTLGALARTLKRALPGGGPMAIIGEPRRPLRRVAVFTGAGRMAVENWRGQADALITGEISHHPAREAEARGIAVIAAGHFATEQPVVPFFAKHLRAAPELRHNQAVVFTLEREKAPMQDVKHSAK